MKAEESPSIIDTLDSLNLLLRLISTQVNQLVFTDHPVEPEEVIDEILRILRHKTRRRMIDALSRQELFVNRIIEELNEHPQAVVRHLKLLEDEKIVISKKEKSEKRRGRPRTYYTLCDEVRGVMGQKEARFPLLVFLECQLLKNPSAADLTRIKEMASQMEKIFQEGALWAAELKRKVEEESRHLGNKG